MPLGKYYCDYCDKQFQDTPFHRKRHIQGGQHQRAKSLWYASFRAEPKQINEDSFAKRICNRFVMTGSCRDGNFCKYYHPKQNPEDDMVKDSMGVTRGNLPPSLRPPPEGGYPPLPFVDWG